jgi:tetratricopeptide (TPR) repeat protein
MNSAWAECFLPGSEPSWLEAFERQPALAVDDLLSGRFDLGPDQPMEPAEAVLTWALELKFDDAFVVGLDAALAEWIADPPDHRVRTKRRAFGSACRIITQIPSLSRSAAALAGWLQPADRLCDVLGIDPIDQVFEDALIAVATAQSDRSALPLWRSLAHLDGDTPSSRGRIGILGMATAPPQDPSKPDGFRAEVADAVVSLSQELLRRVDASQMSEQMAQGDFSLALGEGLKSAPYPELWTAAITRAVSDPRAWRWFATRLDGIPEPKEDRTASPTRQPRRSNSLNDADELRERAKVLWNSDAARAATLSEHALLLDPWNVYSWTIHLRSLLKARGAEAAVPLAWEAVERFPHNAVCWQELGIVLRDSQRFALAEEIWRGTRERFRDREPTLGSLAALLVDRQLGAEAVGLLEAEMGPQPSRKTLESYGNALRLCGRFGEAERLYRPLVDADKADPYEWGGLLRVLRDSGREEEAKELAAKARQRFPNHRYIQTFSLDSPPPTVEPDRSWSDPLAPAHEAATLRRRVRRLQTHEGSTARRDELRSFIAEHVTDPVPAAVERSLLESDTGDPERAADDARRSLNDLGLSAPLLYVSGRTARAAAAARNQRYSNEAYGHLCEPWMEIRDRAGSARPLAVLGMVRAAYALNDGAVLDGVREKALKRLDDVTTRYAEAEPDDGFHSWWRRRLGEQMGEIGLTDARMVPEISRGHDRQIDALEEDYVRRMVPALAGR